MIDFILDVCILIGGIAGLVSMYSILWPHVRASIFCQSLGSYTAVAVSFKALGRSVRLKSVSIKGYKIAEQKPTAFGETFGRDKLHCVMAPKDNQFVDSLSLDVSLDSKEESRDFVFVVRETNLVNLEMRLWIYCWPFPIKYTLMQIKH